jgi:hypothetical protein
MATLKREEVKQLSEPIIIEAGILGDKEYKIEKITTGILDEVNKLTPKDIPKEQMPMDIPVKQLATLLGVSVQEIQGNDLRIIGRVLDFIMNEVTKGLDMIKNPLQAEAKS